VSNYLPPVVLQIKANARDAYAELAKFRAATAAAMKGAADEVNAGGRRMEAEGKKVGAQTGEAIGRNIAPAVATQMRAGLKGTVAQAAREFAEKTSTQMKTAYARMGPVRGLINAHVAGYRLLGRVGGAALGQITSALKTALPYIGIAASSVGLLAMSAGIAATKIVALAKGIASLGPLVAFVPSLIGGFKLISSTVKSVAKGITEDLEPVAKAFERAQKRAEEIGSRGFRQVGLDFSRLNMPAIAASIDSIARTSNTTGLALGKWVNSAPGIKLIRDTAKGAADAFKAAAPAVERAVEALGDLANRGDIADRFKKAGEAVGRLADKFKKWADSKSAQDITNGLKTAGDALAFVGDKIRVVKDAVTWMADNREKVKQFADAFAALGLAIGVATGNPIAIAIGAFTLLANNWDTVKAKLGDAGGWWKQTWAKVEQDPTVQRIVQASKENWSAFKEGFSSTMGLIKSQWDQVWPEMKATWDEIGPTIAAAWEGAKPLVKAFGQFLGAELAAMGAGIRLFLGVVRVIDKTFEVVASTVGGILRRLLGVVASMLDGVAGAVGVFDKNLAASMRDAATAARDSARDIQANIDAIKGKTVTINVRSVGTVGKAGSSRQYGYNATGTQHWRGGPSWVGEHGPELVDLPRGSAVYRTGASAVMAKGGGVGDMQGLGASAAAGLASGMGAGKSSLTSAAAAMAGLIPATTAKVLEIRSPSRRMARLGTSIFTGIQRGMEQQAPVVFRYLRAFSNRIASMRVSTATRTRVQDIASSYLPKFNALKAIDARIQAQQARVQALGQARAQYAQSTAAANYGGAASLIGAIPEKGQPGGTGNLASDYAKVLEDRAKQLAAFRRNLNALKKRGVSKTILSQFAAAGVEQAGDLVGSLRNADGGVLKNINKQAASLATGAGRLGAGWAGEMYNSGIQAAQGILKGLQSQRANLAREMAALAKSLVIAVKRALRIKSPSGVMADEVGRMIPEGVAAGVLRHTGTAVAAVNGMVAAATPRGGRSAVRGMTPGQAAVMTQGGTSGAETVTVVVHLDGREIQRNVQTRSLRREQRNGTNGLSAKTPA
jgi:hypothetical protein